MFQVELSDGRDTAMTGENILVLVYFARFCSKAGYAAIYAVPSLYILVRTYRDMDGTVVLPPAAAGTADTSIYNITRLVQSARP